MKLFKLLSAAVAAVGFTVGASSAHTISIGFEAGTNPGDVTFWVGNYTHGSPGSVPLEGSILLEGVNGTAFTPVSQLFDMNTTFKPTGLVDGTNNFYVSGPLGGSGSLVDTINPFLTVCGACGPVTAWQGTTITGLNPGDYKFTFVEQANPTASWTQWNDSLNQTLTITGSNIGGGGTNPVPLPAGLPLIAMAMGALGFVGWRKKRHA